MVYFLEGFVLQASLIMALGAQNLFLIDIGIRKQHHFVAAFICAICDLVLVLIGVAGLLLIVVKIPAFKTIVGVIGAGFLIYYAALKFRSFLHRDNLSISTSETVFTRNQVIKVALGFTLLNPHVYIDTIFLIGGYSAKFQSLSDRLLLGFGAGSFSFVWFFSLVSFSSLFANFLIKPKWNRLLSLITSILLLYLGISLLIDSLMG